MTIENPQLVSILVFAVAGLLLFQTALVFAYVWLSRAVIQRLDAKIDALAARSGDLLQLASQTVATLENASSKIAGMQTVAQEKIRETMEVIQKADRNAGSQLDSLRIQLSRVNGSTDALLSKFAVQTFKVHRAVLDPSMRLSAILRSALAAVKHAFFRQDGSPAAHLPDRPDFI